MINRRKKIKPNQFILAIISVENLTITQVTLKSSKQKEKIVLSENDFPNITDFINK